MAKLHVFLTLLLLVAGVTSAAVAQDYPAKPVHVVVAYPAGGVADLIVRAVFNHLQSKGYNAVVENRGGGGTQIAAEAAAKSSPDGYTLFATGMETFAITPFIYSRLFYDPVKDFVPVSGLSYAHQILAVPAKSPITSIQDLLE